MHWKVGQDHLALVTRISLSDSCGIAQDLGFHGAITMAISSPAPPEGPMEVKAVAIQRVGCLQ